MNTFLWTMAILGLIEVGGSMAYFAAGKIPERTKAGMVISIVFWAGVAYWSISLIGGQQ